MPPKKYNPVRAELNAYLRKESVETLKKHVRAVRVKTGQNVPFLVKSRKYHTKQDYVNYLRRYDFHWWGGNAPRRGANGRLTKPLIPIISSYDKRRNPIPGRAMTYEVQSGFYKPRSVTSTGKVRKTRSDKGIPRKKIVGSIKRASPRGAKKFSISLGGVPIVPKRRSRSGAKKKVLLKFGV